MSLFTSARERRLWAWTLAVVAAIYSTLGLARTWAGALRESGLLAPAFVLGMVLVAATVLTQGLKTRPGGAEIAVALGVAAAYPMVFDPVDMLFNFLAGVMAVSAKVALAWARRRSARG